MLSCCHRFKLINIVEFQLSIESLQPSKNNEAASRRPIQRISLLGLESGELRHTASVICCSHGVKTNIRPRAITMNDCEAMAFRFPGKCNDLVILVLEFKDLNWDVSLLNSKQLKPSVGALLCFCVSINLDSKIFSIILPIHLAVADTEKVFLPQFLFAWNLHKAHLPIER